jgi:hypothetical protein
MEDKSSAPSVQPLQAAGTAAETLLQAFQTLPIALHPGSTTLAPQDVHRQLQHTLVRP